MKTAKKLSLEVRLKQWAKDTSCAADFCQCANYQWHCWITACRKPYRDADAVAPTMNAAWLAAKRKMKDGGK